MTDTDYQRVRDYVLNTRRTGAAHLHQHLLLGKNKIERILRQLEKEGVVSRIGAGGAREVLLNAPTKIQHGNHLVQNG